MINKQLLTGLIGSGLLMIGLAGWCSGAGDNGYRIEFNQTETRGDKEFPQGWAEKANKWGVPATQFYVNKNGSNGVLVVDADRSTGAILFDVYRYVDLSKTPVMRWRWRVNKLPPGADGRQSDKDDQALVLYIGFGSMIRKSVAYRWETETPQGSNGQVNYAGGMVRVAWFCLNNKETPLGQWVTVERNIAEDLRRAYGEVPREFAVSIGGNSQYTKSHTLAEIDYIEFLPPSR